MYTHKHNAIKPLNGGYVIKRFLLELDDLHIICTLVFVYVCTFVYSLSANTTIPFNFASSLMQKKKKKKGRRDCRFAKDDSKEMHWTCCSTQLFYVCAFTCQFTVILKYKVFSIYNIMRMHYKNMNNLQ